jgi:D-apionolactonase
MLPVPVIRRGTTTVPTPPKYVHAGPLTARFEPDGIFLRHIKLGEREVLRGIYVAVRDQNWETITPIVTSLNIQTTDDSYTIEVDVRCNEREIDFVWHGTITGEADGTVHYVMEGTAQSDFWRNRIGILVLHPPAEVLGRPVSVEAPDGTITSGNFPDQISPHQPFFNIQALTHEVVSGVSAEVRFGGDVFEMEDQRNWTDASYKTYSTPLDLPFPVLIEQGSKVSQSVELRLSGNLPISDANQLADRVQLTRDDANLTPLPRIGLGMSDTVDNLSEQSLNRLRQLKLGHLRVDIHLSRGEQESVLDRAIRQSRELEIPLQVALFLAPNCEQMMEGAVRKLAGHEIEVAEWLIFSETEKVTSRRWVELAKPVIQDAYPDAMIASGTNAYFTELNRERLDTELLDAVCYSINPQVHAFDDLSLVETLEAQFWTVKSACAFSNGRDVVTSPITLRPRFNPNATGPEPEPEPGQLPASVDPRQMSLLGAGWTLGSLKYISQSNVVSGTWFETVGWKGVMETETGSPLSEKFQSLPGSVFPMWHVFADVGEFRDGEIVTITSSNPLRVDGCLLQNGAKLAFLIANLTGDDLTVEIELPEDAADLNLRILDETNAEAAMTDPDVFRSSLGETIQPSGGTVSLSLRPFAYARVSGHLKR